MGKDPLIIVHSLYAEGSKIPNTTHPDVPIGPEDKATLLKVVGVKPTFSFPPKDHIELGTNSHFVISNSPSFYLLKQEHLWEYWIWSLLAKYLVVNFTTYWEMVLCLSLPLLIGLYKNLLLKGMFFCQPCFYLAGNNANSEMIDSHLWLPLMLFTPPWLRRVVFNQEEKRLK